MNWFHRNLCLIVVILVASSSVFAEENHNSNVEEELVPAEQTIDNSEISGAVKKKVLTKPVTKSLKPFVFPNLSRNIGPNTGFPFAHGLIQAPLVGLPLDAQASSATNNVLLVLNNDKNKLADLTNPSEQSLKRLTRTPDVMDDMVAQARGLGEGVTQQVMGQLTESGSGLTRQLGQGLNDLVRQTATLAQTSPGNIDVAQLAQTIRQSTPVGNFDFGSFGEGLTRSFLEAATQNVFNPPVGQAAPDAAVAEEADIAESLPDVVGAAAEAEAEAEPEPAAEPVAAEAETSEGQRNPFESMLGSVFQPSALGLGQSLPALQALTALQQALPLGLLGPLSALNPLMAMGSEISEVRVKPDQYSPYKLSPKQVDQKTMAEMKLKAVLKDALNKKTLPILWFHLSNNQNVQKSSEDLEMEVKLKNFEKRVIAELKHLQDLAKLANIVKEAQLESGVQPTKSLTTKLNLHDIPIYDITLGDIESTLKDEHVIMLMHTIVQRHHREQHRHHQATTKYLTDLTGTPIKRQTKTAEDVLKSMERDEILKMLTYAYRMAAASGHEMPWLKDDKVKSLKDKDVSKSTATSQAKDERQWLEDKQRQMAMEAEKQRQMAEEKKILETNQNQFRQWADAQMTQQPIERQWANANTMQQQMPLQRQMVPTQMQQPMPIQNQMFDPNMQQQQMFNMQPQLPEQRQWIQPTNMQQQQQPIMTNPMMQRQWADPNMQPQPMPIQRQWAEMPETKSSIKTEQLPEQRQAADTKMPEQPSTFKNEKQTEQRQWAEPTGGLKISNPQAEQRQWIDTKAPQQTATKTNEASMMQRQWADANKPQTTAERTDSMPLVGEAKPQMAENGGQARHKGMEDMFNEFDVFDHGKHKEKDAARPTVINYYYNAGGGRYQPLYAAPQALPPRPPAVAPAPSYGYVRPAAPPPPPAAAPAVAPAPSYAAPYGGASYGSNAYGSYSGYRAAVGDEEIAIMLQQHQPMPKIMPRIPTNDVPTHAITNPAITTPNNNNQTTTENHINNAAEDLNNTPTKRLDSKQIHLNLEPAAYIIVIRNNTNKLGKQVRSRRKRSATEYATLEPIDESSLNALRKTYKNSLKEITLNPDETPADALRRYNAESIREALEKANQKPMEISAGGEGEEGEVKEEIEGNKFEPQTQHIMPQLPQSYVLNNNVGYMPQITATVPNQINNESPYVTYPVHGITSQAVYEPSLNQEGVYNNFIPKFNQPQVFSTNNRAMPQNPFLSMYHSLESVPYMDDYNLNNQAYQITNHNIVNNPTKASKSIVYQKSYAQPQMLYNHMTIPVTKSGNGISKNRPQIYTSAHHVVDYDKSQNSHYLNDITEHKNVHSFSQKPKTKWSRQPQNERHKISRARESASFENLMAVLKERLAQCCNECKENILKSLDETLKQRQYDNERNKPKVLEINVKPYGSIVDRAHPITYRKPNREEDFEYKQWLMEMSEKGYDQNYLTKQHQRDYLKNGKLNLHIEDEEDNGAEREENVFYKNNQSYKRETTEPEVAIETLGDILPAPVVIENNSGNLTEQTANEGEEEEEEDAEQEEEEIEHEELEPEEELEIETETEKPKTNEIKAKEANKKSLKDSKSDKVKFEVKKLKPQTEMNSTQKLETAESTTHSVYALRGQFRPHKHSPMPFALRQGKQFSNYKNINKLDPRNLATKAPDNKKNAIDKDDKLEEILDILHDLTIQSKAAIKTVESSSTTSSTTTTSTTTPLPIISDSDKNPNNTLVNKDGKTSGEVVKASTNNKKEGKRRRIRIPSKSRKVLKKSSAPKSETKLETET